jgi:hypothetical protein
MGNYLSFKIPQIKPVDVDSSLPVTSVTSAPVPFGLVKPIEYKNVHSSSMILIKPVKLDKNVFYKNVHSSSMKPIFL